MESINYLINFVLIVAAALTAWLPAEAAEPMRDPSGEPARQIELDPGVTPKSDRPAVVLERGPDHRVVEWYSEILDESGTSLTLTNRYTEVATGLHFLDAKGEWYETVAAFEEVPNGWVAARGPHQVAMSTDLSVPGSVTVVTVDGVTLRSTPTLLAYVDRSTGQEVHLASLRPTRGELILPGTVLYPNAFDAVAADVRAIYTAAGFECDVILRGALPNPAEFGLNPDTTDLAVFTEFFETQPTKRRDYEAQIHDGELATDVDLDFGAMRMDRGRAFLAPSSEGGELPVRKNWENREGRDFLIERTAWKDLELLFQRLPEGAAAPKSDRAVGKPTASAQLKLPERLGSLPTWPRNATGRLLAGAIRSGRTDEAGVAVASRHLGSGAISPRSFQVSRVSDNRPGVVLDYTLVGTTTDYTFNSLTTYYVSGAVTLGGSGNTVTFQPGTVVKYAKTNTPSLKLLSGTTINWLGAPYRPVVLTAYDDNSVGELLPGATGNPQGTYAYKALELDGAGRTTPMVLTNLCIRHAGIGLAAAYFSASTAILTVRHAQIIHCDGAFQFQLGSTTTDTYRVQNALLYSTNSGNIAFKNQYAARCVGEFLTVRGASTGFQNSGGSSTLSWINSLTVNVGSVAGVNLTNSGTPPSPTLVTAGAGEHYLKLTEPAVVSWFDARPSSLQPPSTDLATELAQTTVMAPVQLPATITSDLTLSRGVDPTLTSPELRIGYHYWPIHFLSSGATITGAKLYLTNGVVVAGTGSALVNLGSNSSFLSWGRPEVLNRLCWVSSVQELPTGGAPAGARQLLAIPSGNTLWPEIQLRLTRVELNADSSYTRRGLFDTSTTDRNLALAKLRDSQFFGTWLNFAPVTYGNQTFDLGNCVFEECRVEAYKNYSGTPSVLVRNCLVRNGTFILYHYWVDPSVPPWTCTDNLFATTGASAYSTSTNRLYAGWNGYTGSSAVFGGISNKVSLNQDWASGGPLGPWYYPTTGTSPSLAVLRNVGSRSAASAELYHYTTQVNQLKDGMDNASQVDIGFHYPAVSGGSWADSDGDGLPDVVEDNDGDGLVDSNETDWTQADTDGDGALDGEESSGSTDPKDKTSWIPKRLAAWWWDNAGGTWRNGDRGQTPIQTGAEINALGAVSNGVKISASTNSLRYRVVEADGRANLRLDQGSVRLWFKPNDWQLPSYPVGSGSLVGLGDPYNNNLGWWAWYFEYPTNTTNPLYLKFGQGTANVKYEMPTSGSDWSTNKWYELALSYNTNFIRLYRNGVLLAPSFYTGINTNILPTTSGINNGFALGTDVTGQYHIGGTLDCVETFNYSVETVENYRNHQLTLLTVTNGGFAQLQFTRNYEGWPVPSGNNSAEPFPDPRPMTVWRRILGTAGWPTNALLSNSTNQTWIDTSVTAGVTYEYKVQFLDPFYTKSVRHISAGIGIPPQHQRGTALVMVDNTLAPNLTTELNQLTTNLVGDGWLVKLWTNAPRHDDATFSNNPPAMATVVNWITNNHTSGATNVIFIIGHVTIPYSGTNALDNHADHFGAWTCDGYYGFTNKAPWVDDVNVIGNATKDGKFDLDFLPGVPDFAVGRIDFSNLPLFSGLGEVDLIKRYLQKDFRYRRAETPTFGRVTSCLQDDWRSDGANVAQTFSGAFGVASGTLVSANSLASKVPADLSAHYSSGYDSSVWDVGFSKLFHSTNFADATKEVPVTFRNVWFSYACDWARLDTNNVNVSINNWLCASLGWENYGLATMGGFRWDFSCLAAGAPLAETMRRGWWPEMGAVPRFQSILGDPTLRLHRVAPPKAIAVTRSGSNATLTWTPSDDSGCVYYIYRSTNGIAGPFSLLNSNDPIPGFTFSDPNSASNYVYQVRACRLQQTGCGSFWNTSQGVFGKAP